MVILGWVKLRRVLQSVPHKLKSPAWGRNYFYETLGLTKPKLGLRV